MHKPVLTTEITKSILEMNKVENVLDATFGRGGHSKAISSHLKQVKITAIDRDLEAVKYAKEAFSNIEIHHMNFSSANTLNKTFDAIILDLGVNSNQLEDQSRGFSFKLDGPLDMRMDRTQKLQAFHLVNELSERELCKLFTEYGEIKNPQKIVSSIISYRKNKKIESTLELSKLICSKVKRYKTKNHPATNYFLALRIKVNEELESISEAITTFIDMLNFSGRLFAISFHSLEDRILKFKFKNNAYGFQLNKKVIKPSFEEIKNNPRSRSAKLRIFEKNV